MPRRKGQGMSPIKKGTHKDEPHSKNKAADNSEDPGGGGGEDRSTSSSSCDLNNSKYLHKKFKKMATASNDSKDSLVNGIIINVSTGSKISETSSKTNKIINEGFKGRVGIERGSSPITTSRGASPSVLTVPSAPLPPPVSSSSVPQQGRYVCPYCKLPCAKPSVLQKHIRAHTNERPYPCQPCGFAFKTKSNLYKHCRSKAHHLKMEEEDSGMKFSVPSAESTDIEDEEDDSNSTVASSTNITTTMITTTASTMSVESNNNNSQDKPRQIYKPKFHKAAMYQEEEQHKTAESSVTAKSSPINTNLSPATFLKYPSPTSPSSSAMNPNLKKPSSPSPEFLHRHINKIISDNQAIVETVDPHWSKKFIQRQINRDSPKEDSPRSPLSPLSSPGIDISQWPKKFVQRQVTLGDQISNLNSSDMDRSKFSSQQAVQSKLALALLRPSRYETASLSPRPSESPLSNVSTTSEPSLTHQQPLNLSTSNHASKLIMEESSSLHRKRCHSEGFASGGIGRGHALIPTSILKDHNFVIAANNSSNYHRGQSNAKFPRIDSASATAPFVAERLSPTLRNHNTEKLLYHPQNPEGSIIKDILLKARAGLPTSTPPTGVYGEIISHVESSNNLPPNSMSCSSEEEVYAHVCPFCNINFQTAQNLDIHQQFYCKGESSSRVINASPQLSPNTASKYTYYSPHLDMYSQMMENAEDRSMLGGKTTGLRGLQPLSVAKGSVKVIKQEFKPLPLTPPARDSGKSTLVVPPFPSPGPLLGNTPLVDSYSLQQKKREDADNEEIFDDSHRRGPLPKKRRLDSEVSRDTSSTTSSPDIRPLSTTPLSGIMSPSTTTLRSLEELSKCPMRPNSLQMFGGEVQILDGAGETKTMRIEPSSRGKSPGVPSGSDLMLSLPNHMHPGVVVSNKGTSESEGEVTCGSVSPHIVVTIARSGLHSGGTIVQVPQKTSNISSTSSSGLAKTPRTSGGGINPINAPSPKCVTSPLSKQQKNVTGGSMILNSLYSTSVLSSNTNTITNTFPDTTKLLVPIVPNIATPNLTVPGIPAPNLGHPLPFIPYAPFLRDGTLLNPLNSITAYNPLTLPPHTSILHQSPLVLPTVNLPQTHISEKKSPGAVSSSPNPRDSSAPPPPYSGGVVTIIHGGKAIPYVPGMPGPHTVLPTVPTGTRKELSPKPLDLASPSRDSLHSTKVTDSSKISHQSSSNLQKNQKISSISVSTVPSSSHHQKDEIPRITNSKMPMNTLLKIPKTQIIPSIKVDMPAQSTENTSLVSEESYQAQTSTSSPLRKISKSSRQDIPQKEVITEKEDKLCKEEDSKNKKTDNTSECIEELKNKGSEKKPKFLRPSTLPLKPGTFIPKKYHGMGLTPTTTVLISPETPRPRKSYGQLYLNGHAYTYLGLKCSTRAFYCTLNKPQPMYVPQSPEHAKLSMYSNWKICSEADPNPFGLDPGQVMALYDSRHRPMTFTVAKPAEQKPMILTHSSYWLERNQSQHQDKQKAVDKKTDTSTVPDKPQSDTGKDCGIRTENSETAAVTGEPPPRRVKIFDGGFESNEDYIYVRGRGRGRYVCEECGIRCKKPSMLKKHIRTHTDVRPFTCKHCNFSFKTKGNLTKHMKSKAHYKKCMELGIVPVPTVVDDSYIDEECLARQQALRDSRHGDGESESDDNEEEEEDEEDEDEEEEDEQNPADGEDANVNKGKLEREAACSLLSLSESTRVNTSSHFISAGLIPLSSHCGRPTTYPYSLTLPIPGPNCHSNSFNTPQTPTLTAVSAQTEREKVSRNTGLALELRNVGDSKLKEEEGRVSGTIRRGGNVAALVVIPPQQGDANRYYFPSSRTQTIASNVPLQAFTKNVTSDKSVVDTESDSDYERDNSSSSYTDDDEEGERNEILAREKSDKSICEPDNSLSIALQPMDLSNKTQTPRKLSSFVGYLPSSITTSGARTPTTPISEILTPVSEPATLLASICSSVERFPVSSNTNVPKLPDPAETTMLQVYLTERALQDVRIKQHQFHHNHHGYVTTSNMTLTTSTVSISEPLVTRSFQKPTLDKESIPIKMPQAPAESSSLHGMMYNVKKKDVEHITSEKASEENSENVTVNNPKVAMLNVDADNEKSFISNDKTKSKTQISSVVDNIATTKVALVSSNNIVMNVVVGGIGFTSHQTSSPPTSTSGSCGAKTASPAKLKAEFLPPSSGPSPSYVSMTEDGRSICVICNKIFSKPSQLRLHVNIHYFERPFRCESCAVSFRTKGHLQKHERSVSHQNKVSMNSTFGTPTTTNPRPFKCDDCKIAFRIHGHLAKHLRSKLHIMKLECVGKLPFGTYAEMEREGISLNEIDTTDCDNSLESLQVLAQKLYEKDPTKLGHWDGERGEMMPSHPLPHMSGGETSSDEGEPLLGCQSPPIQSNTNQKSLLLQSSSAEFEKRESREFAATKNTSKHFIANYQHNIEDKPPEWSKGQATRNLSHQMEMPRIDPTASRDKEVSSQPEEADYEDASDGDSETNVLSCLMCRQTFPNLGALQVHSFVEHDSSTDTSEEPAVNKLTPTNVPILQNNKANVSVLVSSEMPLNYLSQFRKRPPMTDGSKVSEDSESIASFSKRPTMENQNYKVSVLENRQDNSLMECRTNPGASEKGVLELQSKGFVNQCHKSEVEMSSTCLKGNSSSESKLSTAESAKSDETMIRQVCETDSRQSSTSRQQKDVCLTKLNCDLCGKVQSSRESLEKHLLSHAQPRPFVCEFCDAGFISQPLLQGHLVVHQQKGKITSSQ